MTRRIVPSRFTLAWALLGTVLALPPADHAEPFRGSDRWVAMGDSITHHGLLCRWVELFYLTRFPEHHPSVVNGGSDGDTASAAVRRLDWDVAPEHPTVVSIMLGMNDIDRKLYDLGVDAKAEDSRRQERIKDYDLGLRQLIKRLRADGVRVIVISPSPFDNTAQVEKADKPGANAALAECARRARLIAAETGCAFIDFHGPMTDLNLARQSYDPTFTIVSPDRVHPGPLGELVMTYLFLKAQGITSVVSSVSLDAPKARVIAAENCSIADVRPIDGDGIGFTCLARALPFPIEGESVGALDLLPVTTDLNQEMLQIAGLTSGTYEVVIDHQPIARFSSAELGSGINLSMCANTPQYQQALAVNERLKEKTVVEMKLRNIAWVQHTALDDLPRPISDPAIPGKFAAQVEEYRDQPKGRAEVIGTHEQFLATKPIEGELRQKRQELADSAALAAQPRPHAFEIRRLRSP